MCKIYIFLFASHLLLVNALPFLKTQEHNEESYEEGGYPDSSTNSFYFRSAPRQPFSPFHPVPYPLTIPSGLASSAVEYNKHGLPSANLFNPPPHILSPDWWPLWIQQSHPSRFIIHNEKKNNHDETIVSNYWNPLDSKEENIHQDGTDNSKAKKDTSLLEISKPQENDDDEDVQKDSSEKPTDDLQENNDEHACEETICPAVTESQKVSVVAGNGANIETLLLNNQMIEKNTGVAEVEQNMESRGAENENGAEKQTITEAPEVSIILIDSSPDERVGEVINQEQEIVKPENSENYKPLLTIDFIEQVTTEANQLDEVLNDPYLVPSPETLLDETTAEFLSQVTTEEKSEVSANKLIESNLETTPCSQIAKVIDDNQYLSEGIIDFTNQMIEKNTGVAEVEQNMESRGAENENGAEKQTITEAPEVSITLIDSSPDERVGEVINQEQEIVKPENIENYKPLLTIDFIGQVTTEANQLDKVLNDPYLVPSPETLLDETTAEFVSQVTTEENSEVLANKLIDNQDLSEDIIDFTRNQLEDPKIQISSERTTTVDNRTVETAIEVFLEKTPVEPTQKTNQDDVTTELVKLATTPEIPLEVVTGAEFLDHTESDAENISPDHTELSPREGILDSNVAATADVKGLPSKVTESANYQGAGVEDNTTNQNTVSLANDQDIVGPYQAIGDEGVELKGENSEKSEIEKEVETTEIVVEQLNPKENSFTTEEVVSQLSNPKKEVEQLSLDNIDAAENEESTNYEISSIDITTEHSPSLPSPNAETTEGEGDTLESNLEDVIKIPTETHEVNAAEADDGEYHSYSLDITYNKDHNSDHIIEFEYRDHDYHESYDELGGHEIHEDREDSPSPVNTLPEVADDDDDSTDDQEEESSEEGDPQIQINDEGSNPEKEGDEEEDIYKKRHTLLGESRVLGSSEAAEKWAVTNEDDDRRDQTILDFVAPEKKNLESDIIEAALNRGEDDFGKVDKEMDPKEVSLELSNTSVDNTVTKLAVTGSEDSILPNIEIKGALPEIIILKSEIRKVNTAEQDKNYNEDQRKGNIAENQQITKVDEISTLSAKPDSDVSLLKNEFSTEKQLLPKKYETPLITILSDLEIIEPKITDTDKERNFSENQASNNLKQNSQEIKLQADAIEVQSPNYSDQEEAKNAQNPISNTFVSDTISQEIGFRKLGENDMLKEAVKETVMKKKNTPDNTKNEKVVATLIDVPEADIVDADIIQIPDGGKKAVEIETNDKSELYSIVTKTKDESTKETNVLDTTENDKKQ